MGVNLTCFIKALAGFRQVILMVLSNTKIGVEYCWLSIDIYCLIKVKLSLFVFLLLLEDVSKSIPRIIMSLVSFQGFLVAFLSLFEVFIVNELVSTQSMCITEVNIELYSPTKEFQSRLVLLLQGIAVSKNAPGLRRLNIAFQCIIGKTAELHLLFQVP